MAHAAAMSPSDWIPLIRRADIPLDRKGALLILASYANYRDDDETGQIAGEGVHPGIDRYAQDLRKSPATARRYLAWAREIGVIELVCQGNRRRGLSDEYRLTLSVEALERLGVPDPTRYKELIGVGVRARKSTAKAARTRRATPSPDDPSPPDGPCSDSADRTERAPIHRSPKMSDERVGAGVPPQLDQRSPKTSDKAAISAQIGVDQRSPMDERPPKHVTTPHISFTIHEEDDLRTKVAVAGARGREDPNSSIDGQPQPDSGTATPAAQFFTIPARPTRPACRTGLGICVTCYASTGAFTLAANPHTGSYCAHHTRERATA